MKRNISAFTLIEVIVSSAIAATVVGSMFALSAMSIRLSIEAQQRMIASELSREGLEVMRQIRDVNFVSGLCSPPDLSSGANPTDFNGRFCSNWAQGIVYPTNSSVNRNPIPMAVSVVSDPTSGFKLVPVQNLTSQDCTDYFVRNLSNDSSQDGIGLVQTQSQPKVGAKQELYCRRIYVEPVDLGNSETQNYNAIRIRVQVAWTGFGRNNLAPPGPVKNANPCKSDSGAGGEWCTEQSSLLTNWRAPGI